jgi:hypothetical protein
MASQRTAAKWFLVVDTAELDGGGFFLAGGGVASSVRGSQATGRQSRVDGSVGYGG